jgi:hypothetical protein
MKRARALSATADSAAEEEVADTAEVEARGASLAGNSASQNQKKAGAIRPLIFQNPFTFCLSLA